MANTVLQDRQGPDWPLGFISVATPGTPVGIMSLVDQNNKNDPSTATSAGGTAEYTQRCQQIMFQGFKPGASHGMQNNSGLVYIIRRNAGGAGSGNRDDPGVMVFVLSPGQTIFLASAPAVVDVFSPYRYSVDADNAGDGALVTLLIF